MNSTDPKSWKFPVLASLYGGPLDFTPIRELSDEETQELEHHKSLWIAAKNRFVLFKILNRNYSVWVNYIHSLLTSGDNLNDDQKAELDRLLMNFLSSAKALIDHFKQHWVQKHRDSEREKEFLDFTNRLCAEEWAFGFFQDLRNFTQHCGLPVGNYQRSCSDTSVELIIGCDSAWLCENYDGWKKSNLDSDDGFLNYVSLTRAYWARLNQDLGRFLSREFAPPLIDTHNFFANLQKESLAIKSDSKYGLITGYDVHGENQFTYHWSSPPIDLFGDLGITVQQSDNSP